MPLKRCQDEDKPGWKWGDAGKCYVYTPGDEESEKAARKKAMAQAAAMGEFPGTGGETRNAGDDETLRAPIEYRDSKLAGVNFSQRTIELIVVPYEESALVEYRGEMWNETFMRGSYDGIEKRPGRVRGNRDHDDRRLVGKAVKFYPARQEGLVAEVRISRTPLGDETLALADDDVLGVSAGFAVRGRDQEFERRTMTRRIKKAFLDHIAFVPDPAYQGAGVLAVRNAPLQPADLPKLDTPNLDELRDWLVARSS